MYQVDENKIIFIKYTKHSSFNTFKFYTPKMLNAPKSLMHSTFFLLFIFKIKYISIIICVM